MTTQEFIFSRKRKIVFLRHSAFWLLWICYFALQTMIWRRSMMPAGKLTGYAFFTVTSTTWCDMIYCYLIIYFLLPRFFFKGYFLKFFIAWIAWTIAASVAFRYVSIFLLQTANTIFKLPQHTPVAFIIAFFSNFGLLGFEGCVAAAIVLGKNWYFNNQSLLALKSNRNGNSQLMRAQQHLVLPFAIIRYQLKQMVLLQPMIPQSTLYKEDSAVTVQQNISETLQLAEQVMEHAQFTTIRLADELLLVEEYLALRQQEYGGLFYSIDGDAGNFYILPNLLLSLTYIPFAAVQNEGGEEFKLIILVKDTNLSYEFSWKGKDSFSLPEPGQYDGLKNLHKLLNFYYYENFSLEMEKTMNGMCLHFQLTLKKENS